jgi:hypothetical protein
MHSKIAMRKIVGLCFLCAPFIGFTLSLLFFKQLNTKVFRAILVLDLISFVIGLETVNKRK